MENNTTLSQKNKVLAQIANNELCIRTLDTSKINSLNFHDLAVWDIKTALRAAYEAGQQYAYK